MKTLSFFSGRKVTGIIKKKITDLPMSAKIEYCELLVNDAGIVVNRVDVYFTGRKFYFIVLPF